MNEDVVCLVWKKYMTAHVLPELLHAPNTRRLLTQSNLQTKDGTVWIPHHRRFPNVPDNRVLRALVFFHDVTNVRFHVGGYVIDNRLFWAESISCDHKPESKF